MPYEVMRVREMIDAAFGDKDASCPVDFNLIGSVMYIIARRLKLTKRTFKVKIQPFSRKPTPQQTFQLDEIKIHTTITKKVRKAKKKPTNGHTLEIHSLLSDKKKRGKRQASCSAKSPGRKKPAHNYIDSCTVTGDKSSTDERSTKKTKCDRLARDTFLQDGAAGVHQTSDQSDDEPQSERRKYSVHISTGERRRAEKYNEMFTSYSPIMHISSKSSIGEKSRSDKYAKDAKAKGSAAKKRIGQKGLQIEATGRFKENESLESTSDDDDETFVVTKEIHEKMYVVTRTPSWTQEGNVHPKIPKLSPVVTQAQFFGLLAKIRILQNKYGVTPQWNRLDQPISITDPRAAMNISMRLDSAQARLDTLLNIVTEIANQTPGIDIQMLNSDTMDTKKYSEVKLIEAPDNKIVHSEYAKTAYSEVLKSSLSVLKDQDGTTSQTRSAQTDNVTHNRLRIEVGKMRKKVQNTVNDEIADAKLEKCGKSLPFQEIRINKILGEFKELEDLAERGVDKIGKEMRAVDEYMTVKLGYFQDSLIQMQGDLDVTVEAFNESLSKPKEDPAAVKHMDQCFSAYKKDLAHIGLNQINLRDDIKQLLDQVQKAAEEIKKRLTHKCTRAEMYASLRNKLTVEDINGFLHVTQFSAVTEENRRQLKTLSTKTFGMERDWQKAIEEFHCKLVGSPTRAQVASLDASVQQVFDKFNSELNAMFAIVGPIKKYPTDKKLIQERNCLCCGTNPEADENRIKLKIWPEIEPTTDKAVTKSTEIMDQTHGELCLPGHPIPHPLEQNSYICQHDCGEIKSTTDKLFSLHIKNLNLNDQGISYATTYEQPVQVQEYLV